ncbi:MAG: hypothetical protein RBS57_00425 [Desulforhabdus sp.]|jgi:hypothetical protein|nr:hypothetical protein [Desulforhabdus sp.]
MPPFGPVKRKDLIRNLKRLASKAPFPGENNQFVVKGEISIRIPNPHQRDIGKELQARILSQAGISREDWEKL